MKKTILVGLIAGITGIAIGYKVPKDKNVGYVMISGRITNPEQAGKYFAAVNDVVVKGCGAKTLTVIMKQMLERDTMDRFQYSHNFQAKRQHKIAMKVIIKILFL